MLDLLAATAVVTALVALGLAVLAVVTLVPFVLTLRRAEAHRFASAQWGAVSLLGSLAALALGLLLLREGSPVVAVGALPLAFLGPLLLWALDGHEAVGGRAGRHE